MFFVKATYNGEIRKFSFPQSTFPSFEQLDAQLNRVFPSSNSYYLSKLLFFPDSSSPARILIANQVCNAEDYNKGITPFRGRTWAHASLRFSIVDGTPAGQGLYPNETVGQLPWSGRSGACDTVPQANAPPPPLVPPPPGPFRSFSGPTDSDQFTPQLSNPELSFKPALSNERRGTVSCCTTGQVKKDVEDLIRTFQRDLDRTMDRISEASVNLSSQSSSQIIPSSLTSDCSPLPSDPDIIVPLLSTWGLSSAAPTFVPSPPQVRVPIPSTPPPPPVIHQGVICDSCDLVIEGTRHKCLDCPDYDLCTSCIANGAQERHNPRHEFLDIFEPGRVIVHTVNMREDRLAPLPEEPVLHQDASTSAPVLHHATCDLCDSVIEGHRYKCAVCPDFDTCELCFAITEEQHPGHSFIKIASREDYILRNGTAICRHFARCDSCNHTIKGVRYKCLHRDCPDFDLCERCEALPIPQHPDNHPLLKMRSPETVIPTVFRSDSGVGAEPQTSTPLDAEILCRSATPSPEGHSSASPQRPDPNPFGYSLYPLSAETQLHANESIDETSPADHPITDLTPRRVDQSPSLSSASISLLNVDDTPAVPGSWYGAGLASLVHSPIERVMSVTDDSAQISEESSSGPSATEEEAMLDRPSTPKIREVYAPNDRSLKELLTSPKLGEDQPVVKESSHRAIEPPPSTEYYSISTPPEGGEIKQEAINNAESLSAGYVGDVTTPDGQIFAAGVTFMKVWRMVNNGTQDWPPNTEIVYVGGAQLVSGNSPPHVQPTSTVGPLKPGEEKHVWTPELKAPDTPGEYTSYWRLRGNNNEFFGDSFWVQIQVVNPSEATHDDSLISSSKIIMPDPASPRSSTVDRSTASRSPTTGVDSDMTDDYLSDDSSVSLLSMGSSDDEADWEESRAQAPAPLTANLTQQSNDHGPVPASQAMDYVLLYDDNTSDED